MSDISPDLVERMVACIRAGVAAADEAASYARNATDSKNLAEARAILSELPVPVDPDLIEAREVVCGYHHDKHPESPWHNGQADLVRSGRNDNMLDVQAAYHGIKRGRELERVS